MLSEVLIVLAVLTGGLIGGVEAASLYSNEYAGDFGPSPIGFRNLDLFDTSRTYDFQPTGSATQTRYRPVRIYLWYPAVADAKTPSMTFGRYLDLARTDLSWDGQSAGPLGTLPLERALSEQALDGMKPRTTLAVEKAAEADGKYPLIVVGQGLYYENPISHFALCEYFASHGYVVATCPLQGTNSPAVRLTIRDLESIVRDLEFVIAHAVRQSNVDPDRIGLIGHDMGGMAVQVLQMRNDGIDAVLTLDAGIIFPHFSGLPGNHPSFDASRLTAPWMHMTQRIFVDPNREMLGESLWGKVAAERYLILFDSVQHVNFTSYGVLDIPSPLMAYWGPNRLPNIPVTRAIGREGLLFMNAHVNNDAQELARLTDEGQRGDASGIYTLELFPAAPAGATFDEFLNRVLSGDATGAVAAAREFKKRNPQWTFYPENDINDIGYRFLYFLSDPPTGLEILKLNVDMYPQSANVYDSYGEGLVVLGRTEEAIASYTRSLELNPENENARRMLEELQKP